MKQITLNLFQNFHCIADRCRHSCCIGWEIDIDEDTLALYRQVSGDFGSRLAESIDTDGTPHFRLGADERCPFLNERNLCDIILHLGEESLCQICNDHPRFRSFFSDRTETGLGLCCEAAAKQILSFPGKAKEVVLETDSGGEPLSAFEKRILAVRRELLAAAQDRTRPFAARLEAVSEYAGAAAAGSLREWAAIYQTLERLDSAWDRQLDWLAAFGAAEEALLPALPDAPFEQILVYFLYRHLPNAADERALRARAGFAALSCRVLRALCAASLAQGGHFSAEHLAELGRMYSAEIEYSDENTDRLLAVL